MTDGGLGVTNGWRSRARAVSFAGTGLFFLAVGTVNALNVLHDLHGRIAPWKPFVTEYSSCAVLMALMPLVAWLLTIAPWDPQRWRRFAAVHGAGTVAYSLLHVAGFVLLRKLVFAAVGQTYRYEALSLPYEYLKDLVTYTVIAGFLILAARVGANRKPTDRSSAIFEILEGARVLRVPVAEIAAASAAGNYVQFHLIDRRSPLMRTTLSQVAAALAPHGFVRTHRSWLVNPERVRSTGPEGGSGDYRLELDSGLDVPLSRRFPQALGRLSGATKDHRG